MDLQNHSESRSSPVNAPNFLKKVEATFSPVHEPIPWKELGPERLAEAFNIIVDTTSEFRKRVSREDVQDEWNNKVSHSAQVEFVGQAAEVDFSQPLIRVIPLNRATQEFRLGLPDDLGSKLILQREIRNDVDEDLVIFQIRDNASTDKDLSIELIEQLELVRSALEKAGLPSNKKYIPGFVHPIQLKKLKLSETQR